MKIDITVKDKVVQLVNLKQYIVCGNSDYTINFLFDDEWSEHEAKTARFVWGSEKAEVVFTGNECPCPIISDTLTVKIGVYAGDLESTTPAYVMCRPSILCGSGGHNDPSLDVYNQLMGLMELQLPGALTAAERAEKSARNAEEAENAAAGNAVSAKNSAEASDKSADSAAKSAELAGQIAVNNGFAQFYMKNGRTYLVRTSNIADKVDFEQVNGRLVVKISG